MLNQKSPPNTPGSDAIIPFSQKVAKYRLGLVEILENNLDDLLADKLKQKKRGQLYTDIKNELPQVEALMKVLNCLVHGEEFIAENENESTLGQGNAARKLYNSLEELDKVAEEVQEIILTNYHIIEPVITQAQEHLKKAGWLTPFKKLETAQMLLKNGRDLIDPESIDSLKWKLLVDGLFYYGPIN